MGYSKAQKAGTRKRIVATRLDDYAPRPAHLNWLLDSDPAIRWQVMRDLTDEASDAIAAERSRVATEGWGAQLLARQSTAGNWGEGPGGGEANCRRRTEGCLLPSTVSPS